MYDIKKMTNACLEYNLDTRPQLEEQVYLQFEKVIEESQEEFEKILSINKSSLTYERIKQLLAENKEEFLYKKDISSIVLSNGFISTQFRTSIGNRYAEVESDEEAFLEIINCLKNRDGLALSVTDWNEYDVKHYLLLLVHQTLKIMKIDTSLIDLVPYEECDDSLFDVRKYCFYKTETETRKQDTSKYVYLENKGFEKEANQNEDAYIIQGSFDEVIEKLNQSRPYTVSIYTNDMKLAYRFAGAVHAQNILVNTSTSFAKEFRTDDGEYLMLRHMVYEKPQL